MNIRCYLESDFQKVIKIHEEFYKDEFIANELFDPTIVDKIVITDDNDDVIVYGANRLLVEVLAVTNKRFSVRTRREALIKLFQVCGYTASSKGFNSLHCFIQEDEWLKHLKKYNFKDTKGKSLYHNL